MFRYLRVTVLAYPPGSQPTPQQQAAKEKAQQQFSSAPQEAKIANAGLKALSLYLTVLGSLSSNSLINVSSSATSINNSLESLHVESSADVTAGTKLLQLLVSAPLDAYRNAAVGTLIKRANDSVMTLCGDLATEANAIAVAWGSDIQLVRRHVNYET